MRRRRPRAAGVSAQEVVDAVAAAGLDRWPRPRWEDDPHRPLMRRVTPEWRAAHEEHSLRLRALLAGYGCDLVDYVRARVALKHGRGHDWLPYSAGFGVEKRK